MRKGSAKRTCELMLSFIAFGWRFFLTVSTWESNSYVWEGNHFQGKGVTLKLKTLYSCQTRIPQET